MLKLLDNLKNFLSNKKSQNSSGSIIKFNIENLSFPVFSVLQNNGFITESNKLFKQHFPEITNLKSLNKNQVKIKKIFSKDGINTYVVHFHLNAQHLNEALLAFFDSSPIPNLLIDSQGKVERINDSFAKLMGDKKYKESEWFFSEIIHKSQIDIVLNYISDIASNKQKTNPIEINIIGNHKITCFLFITKLPNFKELLLIHLIDITEHKNLEITFAHSQKMQALGQLAGGIAHDFNNLLTAMLGFSDLLLLRHPAGDPSFSDIMQIKQNVNRATSLVRQLLAFSKKQVLNIQLTDANEILAELSQLLMRLIGENIKLQISYDRNLKAIKVDQGQLEQVIINLAVNARDSMSNGGDLIISSSNVTVDDSNKFYQKLTTPFVKENIENGEYILITVSDTGCGIPKKLINQIFEPFFSTKEIGAGTGLGLSTVYGIIKQSGGYLFLETKENIGTKFYILLKAYEHDMQQENSNNLLLREDSQFVDLSGSETILVVEDEKSVIAVSSYALKNKGYTVLEADNGYSALDIIKQYEGKIDLIISDIVMPGIDGPEMIKQVHKLYPNIRVIFISGYTEHALIENIVNNKKVHFLSKPFSLKQLALKAKEVLSLI